MRRTKRRMSASERRAQLIEVGKAVFAEQGYEATSVEEIAARAKVSRPVLYEHFGGKEGLYAVIIDREMERLIGAITDAISTGSARERSEQAVIAMMTCIRDDPDGFSVLWHDAPTSVSGGQLSSLLAIVAERVGEVFSAAFREAGYDVRLAPMYAQALIGMVTFVGAWWMENRQVPVDKVATHLHALAWMGLRHLPAKPHPVRVPKQP
ncbi:MAG: TetR/AcrR family transcriptional regulator [Deltaproteobacteria bacterium]|nr:MAG: TetR/AcrR family transcriptional regulator [Deltaproteobacteria bacterium]